MLPNLICFTNIPFHYEEENKSPNEQAFGFISPKAPKVKLDDDHQYDALGLADIQSLSWIYLGFGILNLGYLLWFVVIFIIFTLLYLLLKTKLLKIKGPAPFFPVILVAFMFTAWLFGLF